jgi:oxygen-independent coproporphyrinogen-3 oxidase
VAESEQIPEKERSREYLIFRLRTVQGISGQEYSSRFRMDFSPLQSKLEEFARQGWAQSQPEGSTRRWRFTPKGFLVSNQLIGQLLEVQEAEMLRTAPQPRSSLPPDK